MFNFRYNILVEGCVMRYYDIKILYYMVSRMKANPCKERVILLGNNDGDI